MLTWCHGRDLEKNRDEYVSASAGELPEWESVCGGAVGTVTENTVPGFVQLAVEWEAKADFIRGVSEGRYYLARFSLCSS